MRSRVCARSLIAVTVTALVVGALGAPGASAATGDIAEFALPPTATVPQQVASDADGVLWVTLAGSGILAKSGLDGVASTVVPATAGQNTGPQGIVLGPDGRMWYVEQEANRVSAVTTASGAVQSFPLPNANSGPRGIALGRDGNLWFTEFAGNRIGRITPTGVITEFPLATGSGPSGITTGPDGNLWFTLLSGNAIGQITTAGVTGIFPLPNANSQPAGITTGPDGNLWFTQFAGNRIGRISTAGALNAEFPLPANTQPNQIVTGADGNVWFTATGSTQVWRITRAGSAQPYAVPAPNSQPIGITAGADGNVWITEAVSNRIARVLTGVVPANTAVPAISGPGTAVGQQLTATTGTWSWRPTAYIYQWQRCSTTDATSCAPISGATASTYTITTTDAGQRLRVLVNATNLNGTAASAAASAMAVIGAPVPPPTPAPVSGGQTVTLAAGVTATLKGPKRPRRSVLRSYAVKFNSTAPQGTVRITIVNSTGQTMRVIAPHRPITGTGLARRLVRVTKSVPPGLYTLKAVYTPRADQAATYPVATMTKPITIRP